MRAPYCAMVNFTGLHAGPLFMHTVIYHSGDPHRQLLERSAGPDLCH